MIFVSFLYALFASVFIFAKSALEYTTPLFLVGARMSVAGLTMCAVSFFFVKKLSFSKRAWLRLFLLGIFNIYLTNILEFWGLRVLTAFKTCFIYSLSPFVAAILSYWLFKERLSSKKIAGLIIGFIGFVPVLVTSTPQEEILGQLWVFSWAELAVIGAAFFSVWGWILLKQLVQEDGVSFFQANGMSMVIGGALALLHSFFHDSWSPLPVTDWQPFLESTIALMIVSNFLAYNLYGYLLKRYTATFISFAGFMTPCFTALFGWLRFGETVHLNFILSYSIVLFGLILFYLEELQVGVRVKNSVKDIEEINTPIST